MPNITPYDAGNLGLQPSEIGVESVAAAGRRLGVYGSQIADVRARQGAEVASTIRDAGQVATDYMTHRAISAKSAEAAQMFLSLDQQWNDTVKNADPNDPAVAQKFREEVLEPTLDRFNTAGGITTEDAQSYTDGVVQKYRQHFFQKTAADMSTMAGIAAKQNATESINKLSGAVYLDPSSLDTAIDVLKHSSGHTVDSSPTIDAETGARIKAELNQKGIESLVKSAAMGAIEKNPNFDVDAFGKKYSQYVNGAELRQFQKAAIAQEKANRLTDRQLEIAQQREDEKAVAQKRSQIFTDGFSYDPQSRAMDIKPETIEALKKLETQYPGVDTAANIAMMKMIETQGDREAKNIQTDPKVEADLLAGIGRETKPTTDVDIMRAAANKQLSPASTSRLMNFYTTLTKEPIRDPSFHPVMESLKSQIEQQFNGHMKFAQFYYKFMNAYQASGGDHNALNLSDDNSLISKMAKDYLPSQDQVFQYHLMKNFGADPTNIQTFNQGGGGTNQPGPPHISTKAQYDALPKGTRYISAKDGQTYEKQ